MPVTGAAGDALTVVGVSHSYGPLKALDTVSLTIGPGAFVALLGVNGAGKTTLFSLVTRLHDNVSGSILVRGHDVRRQPGPALAELGVVFQSRSLDRDLSVRQNLRYHASLHGLGGSDARRRVDALIDKAGLADKAGTAVAALSGGQARRAEIARALIHRPSLLLLDEATVGLDIKARRAVIGLVRDLAAREGVGVLWATHLFDEVRPEDQVVLLHKGKVLAADTAAVIAGADDDIETAFLRLTTPPATPPPPPDGEAA